MTVNEIRKKFLDYFAAQKHAVIESDSLVPKDDPTVLFTTAGMQQFKRQFLGHIDDFTRAATSQKCLRTDDLDEVGVTDFHHTFFEMLGNFSFGDYFKKEAITWAWNFLTDELKIPAERLWVSVYEEDGEAEQIWKDIIGVNPKKIFRLGGKSNFWPSNAKENGPNGPCGPCSEIFYDYDPQKNTCPANPDDEPGRFSEVWNLVFTQYNRKDGGVLEPLPGKNIDTGMGLERLAAVIQGKKNNFQIDIFELILQTIDQHIQFKDPTATPQGRNYRYVVADHLRAIVVGIGDGVIPSNKERGSVIRRLITEITDIAVRINDKFEPVIYLLVPSVIEAMQGGYPELTSKQDMIMDTVLSVEKAFLKVRELRIPEFEQIVINNKEDAAALGQNIFTFKDRYGLTVATMENILDSQGVNANTKVAAIQKYETLMKKQQEQSRASSKMTGDVFTGTDLQLDLPKTDFIGYDQANSTSSILKLFIGSERVNEVREGSQIKFILDKTPFYAESGGQIGDTGTISLHDGEGLIQVTDTQKIDDIFIHIGTVAKGTFKTDDVIQASIDIDRRLSIMRNHTATHLMQSALREVLGGSIKQQGSLVDENRLRFDFSYPKQLKNEEIQEIEAIVNVFIRQCDQVTTEYLPLEEARQSGALAFFAEKYGKTVRVVSVGNHSKEFCGGTHLCVTGQIGLFKIVSESAIAQGIRRIEARTGLGALQYINQQERQLNQLSQIFKVPVDDVNAKVEAQNKKIRQLEKDYETLKFEAIKTAIVAGLDDTKTSDGIHIYKNTFKNIEMTMLRKISDFVKQKLPTSIIILGAKSSSGASILIASSDEAVQKGFKANELIQQVAEKIDGQGGGRPQLAQAGGKNTQKVDEAINFLNDILLKGNN